MVPSRTSVKAAKDMMILVGFMTLGKLSRKVTYVLRREFVYNLDKARSQKKFL